MESIAMPEATPADLDGPVRSDVRRSSDEEQGMLVDRVAGEPVWRRGDGALRVVTSFEKEAWRPRQLDRREGFEEPGSCVSFRGSCFEVKEVRRDDEGAGFVYLLAPWDPRFPIRQLHMHDDAHHREERDRRARQVRESLFLYPALLLGSPLIGLLPRHLQRRLELAYGIDPLRMTELSALATFAAGGAMVVADVNGLPEPLGIGFVLGLFLVVEALLRFRTAWLVEEPMGAALVVLPVTTWEALRDVVGHEQRRRRGDPRELPASRQAAMVARLDLVQPVEGGGIVVRSFFPKSWSDRVTISLDGRFYTLRSSAEEPSPEGMVFVYAFDAASMEEVLRAVTPYRPDEGLRELVAREREIRADRLNVIAPLLGLLPADLQERFAADGYMPRRAVQASSLIFGLGAALQIGVSISDAEHPLAAPEIAASAYLLVESAVRLYRVLYGEVTGSLLGLPAGILLRGIASRRGGIAKEQQR